MNTMKSNLITKYWPYAANLKNCIDVCSVHFIMFIHFYLVDVRHFENHIIVYFLALFGAPFGLALYAAV